MVIIRLRVSQLETMIQIPEGLSLRLLVEGLPREHRGEIFCNSIRLSPSFRLICSGRIDYFWRLASRFEKIIEYLSSAWYLYSVDAKLPPFFFDDICLIVEGGDKIWQMQNFPSSLIILSRYLSGIEIGRNEGEARFSFLPDNFIYSIRDWIRLAKIRKRLSFQ